MPTKGERASDPRDQIKRQLCLRMVTTTAGTHSCRALGVFSGVTESSSTSLIPQLGNFDETTVQENDADNSGANTGAVRRARDFSKSSSRRNGTCMVVMNKMDMAARTDVERRGEDECDGMYGGRKVSNLTCHQSPIYHSSLLCKIHKGRHGRLQDRFSFGMGLFREMPAYRHHISWSNFNATVSLPSDNAGAFVTARIGNGGKRSSSNFCFLILLRAMDVG